MVEQKLERICYIAKDVYVYLVGDWRTPERPVARIVN